MNAETTTNTSMFSTPTWAILELMGHRRKIGQVTDVEIFGSKMCRIEVLNIDDTFHTEFYGGSSIYACTPVSEAVARMQAKNNASGQLPIEQWDMREIVAEARKRGEEDAAKRLAAPEQKSDAPPGAAYAPEPDADEDLEF